MINGGKNKSVTILFNVNCSRSVC